MKISFMTFACPKATFDEVLDLAKRHGYDGIEFRCDSDHQHGVMVDSTTAARKEYRTKLADASLEACCLATSLRFVEDSSVADAPARIELAAEVAFPGLRVFCGPLPDGMTIENAIPRVADNLSKVADLAADAGVELWLETHDSVSLGVHAGAIVSRVNHPSVGINWDNMHPYRNGEPLDVTWEAIGQYVRHTHFHDAVAKPGAPIICRFGEGDLPIREMHGLLKEAGYEGYLSGEWFNTQMGPDPDASLKNYKEGILALA